MELNQLLYFLEVAKQRSFTGAARELHISQPAISKMIQSLEEELGVLLLDRSSRHVTLTDYGLTVQQQATKVFRLLQDLQVELGDVTHLQKGSLRIGLPPMVGEMFFPRILSQFHQQYPNIKIKLHEGGSKKVAQDVAEGNLDVGVSLYPVKEDMFDFYEFAKDPLRLIVSAAHPLASRATVKLGDLHAEPFILYRQDFGLREIIYDACVQSGFKPDIVCETSQWEFMSKIVADGLGVALLPQKVCHELHNAKIKVIPIDDPPIFWHLALIWRKNTYLPQAAQKWISVATAQFSATLD